MARILDLLIVAGTAILTIRLFASGLYRRYRAFLGYLFFATLHEGVLAFLRPDSKAYLHIWILTEPLEWLFFVLVVLELFSLVLQDYRGLSTAGRWFVIAAVCVALLASGLSVIAPARHTVQGILMAYYYVAERAVYLSLVLFLFTILALLLQFPITLSRNILVHCVVFSIYFLSDTAFYLLLSMLGYEVLVTVRFALGAVRLAALAAWLAMLNPAGELRQQSLRPAWMPGREEELVSQLNHLNAALLRATRK